MGAYACALRQYSAGAIWVAVPGPDTPAKGMIKQRQLYQTQVAKTAAAFLSYDYVNEKKGGRGGSTWSNRPEVLATRFEDLEAFAATKSKAW